MNAIRLLLLGCVLGLTTPAPGAEQAAQARLHCWSLRFWPGTAVGTGGLFWELDLTTINSGLNGELALDPFDTGYTHYSFVDLYENLFEETYPGFLALDTPAFSDANGNGFPDFFELSQPVNGLASSGFLQVDDLSYLGTVQATWQRDAGSIYGTCLVSVPDPFNPFQTLNFFHTFQLIEYNGVLTYTPGVSTVSSTLSVTNDALGETLLGPLIFEKSATDPANELTLQSADLTNAFFEVLGLYTDTTFAREAAYPTNYFGSVEFLDGDPTTVEEDYYSWQLSIDDLNDSNGNGIPDFSASPSVTLPREPDLMLTRGAGNLLLSISGDVGVLHHVERSSAPSGAAWTIASSVTLTNDPQVITLPLPTDTTFWRARVPVGSP